MSGSNGPPGRGPLPPGAAATAPGPNAPNGAPAGPGPFHRPFTPPAEITPIRDERPPSPQSTYPHQQFHPGPSAAQGSTGIAGGAPPPASAIAAAEAAAREREERPTSAMKRGREWEGESGPSKKIANEENRARLDNQSNVTPPNHMPSPAGLKRRSSSEARREEQRANENYHPSEAAHHPSTLPPIQNMPPQSSGSNLPPMAEGSTPGSNGPPTAPASQTPVKEEPRGEQPPSQEPAARKMDVDEDYDDDGDDEKKSKGSPSASGAAAGGEGVNGDSKQES